MKSGVIIGIYLNNCSSILWVRKLTKTPSLQKKQKWENKLIKKAGLQKWIKTDGWKRDDRLLSIGKNTNLYVTKGDTVRWMPKCKGPLKKYASTAEQPHTRQSIPLPALQLKPHK